jgi:RHS repeat-associated protein
MNSFLKILLRACSALVLVCAAAPADAQVKRYFTTATAIFCQNPSCNPLVAVTGTVPGADQWSAACQAMWAQAGVEAYIFPGGYLHHGDQTGCYWGYDYQAPTHYRNTSPITIEIPDPKNSGSCDDNCEGNPINPGTGNKFQIETDYAVAGPSALKFGRTYNSTASLNSGRLGSRWRGTYDRSITVTKAGTAISTVVPAMAFRHDGKIFMFDYVGGSFVPTGDVVERLVVLTNGSGQITGYTFTTAEDEVETYNANGRLLTIVDRAGFTLTMGYSGDNLTTVTDSLGRSLTFTYSGWNRLATMTDPAGGVHQYAYDGNGNLASVTFPGGAQKVYHYNEAANISPTPAPHTWTRASVWVCHDSSCGTVYNDIAYVPGNDPLAACMLATSQTYWFGNKFGGALPSNQCYYLSGSTQIAFGSWSIETGCVSGSFPSQVFTAGTPGCPVQLPNALTGITDENADRFATFKYDHLGRATETGHAGGANRVTVSYSSMDATVTDARNTPRIHAFQAIHGLAKRGSVSQPAVGGSGFIFRTNAWDVNGNKGLSVDWNGNGTNATHDTARNLETSRTEGLTSSGATTPQTRTITTQWHSTFRLRTGIAEPLRIMTFTYDAEGSTCGARGALCSRSIQATTDANGSQGFGATPTGSPRTWTYTYNGNGSVLTANGPRTDVADTTTYTYYANNASCPTANGGHATGCRGQIQTITNALSQTTSVTAYNGHGQALRTVDANGLVTTVTYDARRRLTSRTVGAESTAYEYDAAGLLKKVTQADSSFLSYTYDDAHRQTELQDNLGNKIVYTLDTSGNRTLEEVRDPANVLVQTRSRVYNDLNKLFREIGASSQTTEYGYDDEGNVLTVQDPLNRVTTSQYDALQRLKQVTSPAPVSAVAQYGYDGLGQLVSVTDPRGLATTYTISGLGDTTQQASPDTGTSVTTYDVAGNMLTQVDAKNQTTTYTYDALNRVSSVTFHDGSKHNYTYDSGTYGIGRLTGISELDPALAPVAQLAYGYDQSGRVVSDARTVNGISYTTGYRYDSAGRRDRITYPSGRTVDYGFDARGRINAVTTTPSGGSVQSIASGATYHPFGGLKSLTFGNGQSYARTYDQDGRIATYELGGSGYTIGYDAASRIEFITETAAPSNTNNYGYDALDRLTSAMLPATTYDYSYDAVGNRLTKSAGGNTDTYAYGVTSNRIVSITPTSGPVRSFTLDNNGSTTADGNSTYTYDARGRMVAATSALGTTSYHVNALGQRVRRTNTLGDRVFHYDADGRLLAESAATGAVLREYIWLGDVPVAVVEGASRFYVHVDHLNTPRLVANQTPQTVWRWDQQEPFGLNAPDQDPSSLGIFELALRFPGQYADKETNLFYNSARDFDPLVGRYVESDPIGLRGGLNTYLYADGTPVARSDPDGLQTGIQPDAPAARQAQGQFFIQGYNLMCYHYARAKVQEWDAEIARVADSLTNCDKRCFIKCFFVIRTVLGACPIDSYFEIFNFNPGCRRVFFSQDRPGSWMCDTGVITGKQNKKCCP